MHYCRALHSACRILSELGRVDSTDVSCMDLEDRILLETAEFYWLEIGRAIAAAGMVG